MVRYKAVLGHVAGELKGNDVQSRGWSPQQEMREVVTKSLSRMIRRQMSSSAGRQAHYFSRSGRAHHEVCETVLFLWCYSCNFGPRTFARRYKCSE
jgi:hypothetical protein